MAKKIEIQAPAPQNVEKKAAEIAKTATGPKKDPRRQLGIKVSQDLYDDLQTIEQIHKARGESWNMTMIAVQLLTDYVNEHREEIDKYNALIASLNR